MFSADFWPPLAPPCFPPFRPCFRKNSRASGGSFLLGIINTLHPVLAQGNTFPLLRGPVGIIIVALNSETQRLRRSNMPQPKRQPKPATPANAGPTIEPPPPAESGKVEEE